MRKVQEVYRWMNEWAPFSSAEKWDNPGLLVEGADAFSKAVVCLDITRFAVQFAREQGATLLISHHPVIFDPLRCIEQDSVLADLLREGMTALCAHTNLDKAAGGVNDVLAKSLGLKCVQIPTGEEGAFLRLGELPQPLLPKEFARYVKEKLHCQGVRLVEGEKPVQTVALCCGSGGSFLSYARKLGADALVTGDVKHDIAVAAQNACFTLVDAGHFDTEQPIVSVLCSALQQAFADVSFLAYCPPAPMQLI